MTVDDFSVESIICLIFLDTLQTSPCRIAHSGTIEAPCFRFGEGFGGCSSLKMVIEACSGLGTLLLISSLQFSPDRKMALSLRPAIKYSLPFLCASDSLQLVLHALVPQSLLLVSHGAPYYARWNLDRA